MKEKDMFSLAGKRALITGGGTGIGFAIASCFVRQQAEVIIVGRREEILREACKELGPQANYVCCDIAALAGLPELVSGIEQRFGPLDVLVNNAGIHLKKDMLDVTDEEFERVIRTNETAVFALTREVGRRMVERKKGVVIMISSMASQYGIPKVMAYTAAKSAVEGMTRAMAVELSPSGVRVNCIAPGFIATKMSAGAMNSDPQRKAKAMGRTPMGYFGDPEDVGMAAAFLASDAAKYITGVVLPVDGGNAVGF